MGVSVNEGSMQQSYNSEAQGTQLTRYNGAAAGAVGCRQQARMGTLRSLGQRARAAVKAPRPTVQDAVSRHTDSIDK